MDKNSQVKNMDSLVTSPSQQTLSSTLDQLVDCLSPHVNDHAKWNGVRKLVLDDLNTIMYEGPHKGKSALWLLANCDEGQLLLNSDHVL